MIEFRRLTYAYPGASRPALHDIDLEVDEGELVLLTGMSGSGKSTLLSALNGLVPHFYGGTFAGQVCVMGLDTRRSRPADLALRVGTVFQEPASRFITGTVVDELAFGLEVAGLPSAEIRRRIQEITEGFDLQPFLDRKLGDLSGGEQQRVALALALARRPGILLLDEPTSQLDGPTSDILVDWLGDMHRRFRLTTIVAEHRTVRFMPAASRLLTLTREGRLASDVVGLHRHERFVGPSAATPAEIPSISGPEISLPRMDRLGKRKPQGGGSGPRLEARDLITGYDTTPVLGGASLELHPGEIAALVGRNGSGKSTLLRCLMGLMPLQAGEVRLHGDAMAGRRIAEIAREVAYVPQWPSALLFADTVRDELTFTLRNHGMGADPPIDPDELLTRLRLDSRAGQYPRDLSAGEQQRAAIAAVAVTRPGVLLLDEPTLGMDGEARQQLGSLLDDWRKEDMCVLMATHDVEFAIALCDRVLVLEGGQIAIDGPIDEILSGARPGIEALQRLAGSRGLRGPAAEAFPGSGEDADHRTRKSLVR